MFSDLDVFDSIRLSKLAALLSNKVQKINRNELRHNRFNQCTRSAHQCIFSLEFI